MTEQKKPQCKYCQSDMLRWAPPGNSTWSCEFLWVCFNDECPYFVRGWDHMMKTQEVKASYRNSVNPENGSEGPLPCWSPHAHREAILED